MWDVRITLQVTLHTDKKENQIFLIYKKIQDAAVIYD